MENRNEQHPWQLKVLSDHEETANFADFDPSGDRIVTTDKSSARIWNANSGELVQVLVGGHTAPAEVSTAAFSPSGNQLATGGVDGRVCVWDTTSWKRVHRVRIKAYPTSPVDSVAFSPSGEIILTGSANGACLYDAESGGELRTIDVRSPVDAGTAMTGMGPGPMQACFSPAGDLIATLSEEDFFEIWDADTSERVRKLETETDGYISLDSIAFDPAGELIVAAVGEAIQIWDWKEGRRLSNFRGHSDDLYSVVFSPSGRTIVSASSDGTARLWDTHTGEVLRVFNGHTDEVMSAKYDPTGDRVVTAGYFDRTVRIWNAKF